jgi:hypothetical protein
MFTQFLSSLAKTVNWCQAHQKFPYNTINENVSIFYTSTPTYRGRDSSVGIATSYGLDGPGIESRWEARFFAHVQTGPGVHPASCTMATGSFPEVKRSGRYADHTPPTHPLLASRSRKVELYLYPPSGPVTGLLYLFTPTHNVTHLVPKINFVNYLPHPSREKKKRSLKQKFASFISVTQIYSTMIRFS